LILFAPIPVSSGFFTSEFQLDGITGKGSDAKQGWFPAPRETQYGQL